MATQNERPKMCHTRDSEYPRKRLRTGCVAAIFLLASCSAFAQQSGTDLPESFEDFMKGLRGPRNSSGSSNSDAPNRPSLEIPGSTQPPRSGADQRDPRFPDPNPDLPFRPPGTRNSDPAGANGEFGPRPLDPRSRPGYEFQMKDDEWDRRGLPAELDEDRMRPVPQDEDKFDWKMQSTSIADLRFPTATVFRHGDAWLEAEEETAYLDLINEISTQRVLQMEQSMRENKSVSERGAIWEEAFYQYTNARRLAWDNGHLRPAVASEVLTNIADPFRTPNAPATPLTVDSNSPYSLSTDISNFPDDFVGRPVVLLGLFTLNSQARIPNELRPEMPVPGRIPKEQIQLKVMRGTLTAIGSNRKLATVDTQNITFPDVRMNNTVNLNEGPIPVLVKGWVVKNWDGKPLIYSETVRLLSPIPHHDLIRNSTIDKRRLQEEEKWIYYETLTQLRLTSDSMQQQVAARTLGERIDYLMREVSTTTAANIAQLSGQLESGKIDETQFRQQKVSLQRQLALRVARYRKLRKKPESFQTYVDVFQNPEVWHGKLVSLTGHVRHVVSYPGDKTLFDGEMLHELWLFTDDSQHNPAVIVTPNLPADFPTKASVVDRVSVTGCFFKRYVYGSQDTDRIAPLILAGKVHWIPTVDQVQQLVKDGDLPAGSVRAQKAAALTTQEFGETAMTLACVFVILVLMVLWGRAQREERDRIRLRKRVNEVPVFESPLLPGYSAAHSEFITDSNDGLNLPY